MSAGRTAAGVAVAAAPWVYLALLRPWQLRWGATADEAHRDLPGDDLVAHYLFEATRAVSIAAPPDRVWPWIVQMRLMLAGIKSRAERPPLHLAAPASGGSPAWLRDKR